MEIINRNALKSPDEVWEDDHNGFDDKDVVWPEWLEEWDRKEYSNYTGNSSFGEVLELWRQGVLDFFVPFDVYWYEKTLFDKIDLRDLDSLIENTGIKKEDVRITVNHRPEDDRWGNIYSLEFGDAFAIDRSRCSNTLEMDRLLDFLASHETLYVDTSVFIDHNNPKFDDFLKFVEIDLGDGDMFAAAVSVSFFDSDRSLRGPDKTGSGFDEEDLELIEKVSSHLGFSMEDDRTVWFGGYGDGGGKYDRLVDGEYKYLIYPDWYQFKKYVIDVLDEKCDSIHVLFHMTLTTESYGDIVIDKLRAGENPYTYGI